jgi:hypothetical protein
MKSVLLGAICFLTASLCFSQANFTLSGYLKDASNGEVLPGATVYVPAISNGTTSNVYGFYSITLPKGKYSIEFRYLGFGDIVREIELSDNVRIDLELKPTHAILKEITVRDKALDDNIRSIEMSTAELDISAITKMPAFAGEVDVIKSIQLIPGVSTVGEGASGFNVRGGSVGQNMILLDEAPVYQSSHLFGFFSVFNPDAVKDIKLYKGGIPSQYGGRLSSILDIRMREGNSKKTEVAGGLGTIFSRIKIEGPIQKDKSSYILAARRSYADVFAKAFTDVLDDGAAYFYDLTAKTNFNIDHKNRIFFSAYMGRDVFRFKEYIGFNWGNRTATLRWNHIYGNKLFSNFSLIHSHYNYGLMFGENANDHYNWKSAINTYNFKPEYSWFINANNQLNFGGEIILFDINPATARLLSNGAESNTNLDRRKAFDVAIYVGNDQRINDKFSVQYGLRFTAFSYLGGKVFHYGDTVPGLRRPLRSVSEKNSWDAVATYSNIEPRLSFRWQTSATSSVKGSYNRMNQYIHLISNTTASTPLDIWQGSTNNIKPQQGDQVALGYFRNSRDNDYEASAETYYKWTRNQVDYIDAADLFVNEQLESQLLSGVGRAYGVEFYLKKNTGRLTGWLSYTMGKSELKVDGINFGLDSRNRLGQWYPTRFDQRHNVKLATFYDLSKKISLSANFTFLTGTPTTFPTDRIVIQGYTIPYISGSARNNFRIPNYHRLDVAATFHNIWRGKKKRKGEDNLVVSVYNVYARQNPFSVYFSQGTERQSVASPTNTRATQLSMIGSFVPAVTYNFKF